MNKLIITIAAALAACTAAGAQQKTLVAYFSATGTTEKVAEGIAEACGGELFEIVPATPYSSADLDYTDNASRSSREMGDASSRPALAADELDLSGYDRVFLGYPIWWNEAPRVINSFLESHDLSGKTLIPFATSGSSSISNSVKMLRQSYPGLEWQDGRLLNRAGASEISAWVESLGQ